MSESSEPTMVTVYSIKYIATKGIDSFEAELCGYSTNTYASSKRLTSGSRWEKLGVDCFLTQTEATVAGKNAIERKLKCLDKQRLKLTKLLESL